MDPIYQEDPNRQIQPIPSTNTNNLMNFIRNNKLTVAIIVLALLGLIWWFCMRRKSTTTVTNVSPGLGTGPAFCGGKTGFNVVKDYR